MKKNCIILFFLFLVFSCNKKDPFRFTGEVENVIADAVITNFTAEGYNKNSLAWHLKANKAFLNEKKSIMTIEKVNLQLFKNGRKDVFVKADHGILDQKEGRFDLSNNVIVTTSSGKKLYTETLYYNQKEKKLYSNSKVKIILENNMVVYGKGLVADKKLNSFTLREIYGNASK